MFRRRKGGNTEEGNVCPYCKFVNEDAVESCAQCYYSMNLAARDQPMATPSTSGSDLLDTLMGDTELEEEEMTVEAVLSLEDVAVEVDQYEEAKQEDEDAFQFISGSSPTLSKTVEFETPDEVQIFTMLQQFLSCLTWETQTRLEYRWSRYLLGLVNCILHPLKLKKTMI